MVEQLLDFDKSKIKRNEAVISLKAIAGEVGVSKATLERFLMKMAIELPHWGPAKRSPVFLPKGRIAILKVLYFG